MSCQDKETATETCHISEQSLAVPCALQQRRDTLSHPPAEEEVHSCSLPLLPLQARSYFIWGQRERQLPVHHLHSSEFGMGREQQWGSQGCAWVGGELKWPLGPAPAESCTDRQERPVAETIHSHRPALEQVREDQKNWLVRDPLYSVFSSSKLCCALSCLCFRITRC